MAIKNMAASVLTRLKNQSKEEGIPFQMVLQLFAQEEFLRKVIRQAGRRNRMKIALIIACIGHIICGIIDCMDCVLVV